MRAPEPARGMPLVGATRPRGRRGRAARSSSSRPSPASCPGSSSSIGTALGGITDTVLPTPSPSASLVPIPAGADARRAGQPVHEPADGDASSGTVPLEVVGRAGFVVRVYVALPDQEPVAVRDVPVGETPSFVVEELPLEPGRNDVTATLVGPGRGERAVARSSPTSSTRSKPKVTVTAPKNGATVNGATVKITGKTQGRSTVVARNEANGTSATTAAADATGTFTLEVPLSSGTNGIALTATDLAGNVGTAVVTVRRGSGEPGRRPERRRPTGSARPACRARSSSRAAGHRPRTASPCAGQVVTFTLIDPGRPGHHGRGRDRRRRGSRRSGRRSRPAPPREAASRRPSSSTTEFGERRARISITIVK